MKKLRQKQLIGYGGFCNDKLHITIERDTGSVIFTVYRNKRVAKLNYEDVRKVIIAELLTKRKK